MADPHHQNQARVLFVGLGEDALIQNAASSLAEEGIAVVRVADVYGAMAELAMRPAQPRIAMLDVRRMDKAELRFVGLAPRYFQGLRVLILNLEGTSQRLSDLPAEASTIEPGEIFEAVLATIEPVGTQVELEINEPAPATLSTDGGLEAVEPPGESLHEAVRTRMAGGELAAVRRRPPSRTAPVSREEFDALLAGEQETESGAPEGSNS